MSILTIKSEINWMNEDELEQIIEAVRVRRNTLIDARARQRTAGLKIGDSVWFDAKTRGVLDGTVEKINAKTIKVKVGYVTWTVHASLVYKTYNVTA